MRVFVHGEEGTRVGARGRVGWLRGARGPDLRAVTPAKPRCASTVLEEVGFSVAPWEELAHGNLGRIVATEPTAL